MPINPETYLNHGVLGAITLVFALLLTTSVVVLRSVLRDGRERDERLIAVLDRNASATQALTEKLVALQTRFEDHLQEDDDRFTALGKMIAERVGGKPQGG